VQLLKKITSQPGSNLGSESRNADHNTITTTQSCFELILG